MVRRTPWLLTPIVASCPHARDGPGRGEYAVRMAVVMRDIPLTMTPPGFWGRLEPGPQAKPFLRAQIIRSGQKLPINRDKAMEWPLSISMSELATRSMAAEDALYDYLVAGNVATVEGIQEILEANLGMKLVELPLERPEKKDGYYFPADYPTVYQVVTAIRNNVKKALADEDAYINFARIIAKLFKTLKAEVKVLTLSGIQNSTSLEGTAAQCAANLFGRLVGSLQSVGGYDPDGASDLLGKAKAVAIAKKLFQKAVDGAVVAIWKQLQSIAAPSDEESK